MSRVFFAVLLIAVLMLPVLAQDTDSQSSNVCTEEDTQAFLDSLIEIIQAPPEGVILQWLDAIELLIRTYRFQCSGMVLSGDKVPGKKSEILGTMSIPTGLYRAILTTDGTINLKFNATSGRCNLWMNVLQGDASEGAELLYDVDEGCTVAVEVAAEEKWELRLIPISTDD